MDEFSNNEPKTPDDLNEWSKENFENLSRIFKKIIENNKKNMKKINPSTFSVTLPQTNREKIIQKDDVLNLKIMLGKANNIDDFIKNM